MKLSDISSLFSLIFLIGGAEHKDPDDLTGSVRKGDNATDHLVGLTRVDTEVRGDLD